MNDISDKEVELINLIKSIPELIETALACRDVRLPNFYIAGGVITKAIWNKKHKYEPFHNVKDIDIVYFDSSCHLTDKWYEREIFNRVNHTKKIDIKNQAYIHEWYSKKLGLIISPFNSVNQAIDTWLTALAVGFTVDDTGNLSIYAPYGLDDAFNMQIKPNKMAMTESRYINVTKQLRARWPSIVVSSW